MVIVDTLRASATSEPSTTSAMTVLSLVIVTSVSVLLAVVSWSEGITANAESLSDGITANAESRAVCGDVSRGISGDELADGPVRWTIGHMFDGPNGHAESLGMSCRVGTSYARAGVSRGSRGVDGWEIQAGVSRGVEGWEITRRRGSGETIWANSS